MPSAAGALTLTMEKEARTMWPCRVAALAGVKVLRQMACKKGREFERFNHEWTLLPDGRVRVRFIYCGQMSAQMRISFNVPPEHFSEVARQGMSKSRLPGWSDLRYNHKKQLPLLRECLKTVLEARPPAPPG